MKKPDFFRTGSQSLIAGGAQQGFAILHFLLIARWLTVESLGTWAMFLTLTSFVEMARLGLIQNAIVRFGTQYAEEKPQIATAALMLSVGASILGAAFLLILSFILRGVFNMPDLPYLLSGYLCLCVINAVLRLFDGLKMAEQDFLTAAISASIFGGLFLVFTIFFKLFTHNLTVFSLLYCQMVASILTLFTVFLFNIRHLSFGAFHIEWVKRLLDFGRYGMGTNLASMVFQRADILILGSFVSPASLAVYNVATRIITYLDFPLNQLGLALLPKMASQVSANSNNKGQITEEILKMYEKTVASLLALTLPLTLGAFLGAKILVVLLAGSAYHDAAPLLQIMLVASVVKPFGRVFGIFLDAIGKPDWNFKMLIISMCVTLFFNVLLIQPHILGGTEGAAWASALSVIITILIGQMVLMRHFPIRFQTIFNQILPTYKFILKQRF